MTDIAEWIVDAFGFVLFALCAINVAQKGDVAMTVLACTFFLVYVLCAKLKQIKKEIKKEIKEMVD